ncbi:hypothetical protein appser11_18700 [Actinobacillus pleuropneumoniae serovar 11 str. 56153]|nr:hypothetical protein appser11_18700 [Actinobacillus pleuropneumoniae serovar 11 str. 56153]
MLSLYDDVDTQKLLAEHLKKKRKQAKLSRKKTRREISSTRSNYSPF